MKKKFLSVLLAAAMVVTLAACGSNDDGSSEQPGSDVSSDAGGDDVAEVTPEAFPQPYVHYTFDEGAGEAYKIVERAENAPGDNDGATHGIVDSADTLGYADGPVGQAIYLDGKHGLDLNFEATNTDAYTVSYWMNADRLGEYGATLQMGYNIGKANDVAWMNVTQTTWGEADSANRGTIFPVVWSRNARYNAQDGTECFPWMQVFDQEIHGKREWAMITIVATGEEQDGLTALGVKFTRAQVYVNGVMMYDSQTVIDEQWGYDFCLAPDIMKPGNSKFEAWFGINYWDVIYKGFVDDLYVFDTALTPGQVLSLYQLGNPNVESVAPEGTPVEEEPKDPEVTVTGTAIGAEDFTTGFWGAHSDTWAVASGETVSKTFVNWHGAEAANWNNFVVILQNVADAHSAGDNADYVEYGVVRSDNYGWKGELNTLNNLDELGWVLESAWNWETFAADLQGATVTVSVTNNGDTADVVCDVTTAAGASYQQSYKNIAVDGDLYFCLTVDSSLIDLQD